MAKHWLHSEPKYRSSKLRPQVKHRPYPTNPNTVKLCKFDPRIPTQILSKSDESEYSSAKIWLSNRIEFCSRFDFGLNFRTIRTSLIFISNRLIRFMKYYKQNKLLPEKWLLLLLWLELALLWWVEWLTPSCKRKFWKIKVMRQSEQSRALYIKQDIFYVYLSFYLHSKCHALF